MTALRFRKSSYSGASQNCIEVAPILPDFHKSSHSGQNQNCVEVAQVPADFRRSSHSGQEQNCLEAAPLPTGAALRDSKHPDRGYLAFPTREWVSFLTAARAGDL